jgi:hypothetical protein
MIVPQQGRGRAAVRRQWRLLLRERDGAADLSTFALKLGARRALNYAAFVDIHHAALATVKCEQARARGRGQTPIVRRDRPQLAICLFALADLEDCFRAELAISA